MSLYICSLNSGSNGNCYYIGDADTAVLVDVGVSARIILKRMRERELSIEKVKGIFISHEHTDHIRGVSTLAHQHNIAVYISPGTYRKSFLNLKPELTVHFDTEQRIAIDALSILPFRKQHDAADPYSFVISKDDVQVGVITDIGQVCDNVTRHFASCHAVFIESNYEEEMLQNGPYPYFLKSRISGGKGHISNAQAFELFAQHKSAQLSHLFLSHLSAQNNTPALALQRFLPFLEDYHIEVAPRHEATAVYHISRQQSQLHSSKIIQAELPF